MSDTDERSRTRGRLGWPSIALLVGVATLISLAAGLVAGRDLAVAQAAVDRKMLNDTSAQTRMLSEQMATQTGINIGQTVRLDQLERQHAELISRLNSLIDIMWKDEIRREGRR